MEAQLPTDTPLFHQPWWLDATGLPWQLAQVEKGGVISGIWPYFPEKKYGVSLLRNPPLCPYLGPWVSFPADLRESKRDVFEHQTMGALLEQLPPAQVINTATLPGLKQLDLFVDNGLEVKVRQTFLMDLKNASEDTLRNGLPEEYRRNLRKAATEFEIEEAPEEIERLYDLSAQTLARKGLKPHFSLGYLQRLFEAAHSRGQGTLWAARKDGNVQALVWHLWDATRAYYFMAARVPEVQNARALTAVLFHIMNQSRLQGKEIFDFEGSMDPGVAHFYRRFGGRKELYLVLQKNDSLLWRLKDRLL